MHKIGLITFFSLLVLLSYNSYVFSHVGESHRDKGLHFSHPLISESPSPDTKIRLDYFFLDEIEEEGEVIWAQHLPDAPSKMGIRFKESSEELVRTYAAKNPRSK